MGRALEPEVVALRAVLRALEPLDVEARVRLLDYVRAEQGVANGYALDPRTARLMECLRWLRQATYVRPGVEEVRIDAALAEANR